MKTTKKNLLVKTLQQDIERLQDFEECADLMFDAFKRGSKKISDNLKNILNQVADK